MDRLARIIEALAHDGEPDQATYPQQVCAASVGLLGVTGAGLTLMTKSELGEPGAVWASDELAEKVEDVQFALGEGPGLEAHHRGVPLLEPHLADMLARWPFFRPAALDLGVRAVFAFPLQIGVIRLGALTLHRVDAGFLSDDELADALVLAHVATQDIVDLQAQGSLHWDLSHPRGRRARVHQATGMIAAQLDSDMSTALACIRGYAFAYGSTIFDVAADVIARRLRVK